MCQNRNEDLLVGQKVQWRMHKNDNWKTAAVTGREARSIITLGEYREENVFFFQQSKVLLEHATLEYIYCSADDGSRFGDMPFWGQLFIRCRKANSRSGANRNVLSAIFLRLSCAVTFM